MKNWIQTILCSTVLLLSGCNIEPPIEDVNFILSLGIDLDEEDNLVFYESSPNFDANAKEKSSKIHVKALTLRDARKHFDNKTDNEILGSKTQVLLIGKKVIEHEDWFPILDTMYRDVQFGSTISVAIVDGSLSEVYSYEPPDQPYLSIYIKNLIQSNHLRGRTVLTPLSGLHRQYFDKGISISLSEIKKGDQIEITGTTLLGEKDQYVDTLNVTDTTLLLLLQNDLEEVFTFVLSNPDATDDLFNKDRYSVTSNKAKTKIQVNHNGASFVFDINIKMYFALVSKLFPYDLNDKKGIDKFTKMVEQQLKKDLEDFFKKLQEHKIDPVGLGLYARAYEYAEFKKVEDHWGEAFAQSDINLSLDLTMVGRGAVK